MNMLGWAISKDLISSSSIIIHAPVTKVWDALTSPALIKEYLFGTNVVTDWKVGSPILYRGVWHGKTYEDKGVILKFEPGKMLENTYWSSMGGTVDLPENYKKVAYKLTPNGDQTLLTITQDNNKTEADKVESEGNWNIVLTGLKKLVEK